MFVLILVSIIIGVLAAATFNGKNALKQRVTVGQTFVAVTFLCAFLGLVVGFAVGAVLAHTVVAAIFAALSFGVVRKHFA
jgi:hypothetical protein